MTAVVTAIVLAAAVIAAGVLTLAVLVIVMIAFYVGIKIKLACKKCLYCGI